MTRHLIAMNPAEPVYMNQHGNWGDMTLAKVFDSADAAQTFLDGRTMKAGMREHSLIVPISDRDIRGMANDAADCLTVAKRHADLQSILTWKAAHERLSEMLA